MLSIFYFHKPQLQSHSRTDFTAQDPLTLAPQATQTTTSPRDHTNKEWTLLEEMGARRLHLFLSMTAHTSLSRLT